MLNLTPSQLRQAADLQEQIAALETELTHLLEGKAPATVQAPAQAPEPAKATEPATPKKRTMSPAHKAKIKAAQKLRSAKYNAAKATTAKKSASTSKPAKKRKMSAAGRAAIIAGVKARWAKVKAGKK